MSSLNPFSSREASSSPNSAKEIDQQRALMNNNNLIANNVGDCLSSRTVTNSDTSEVPDAQPSIRWILFSDLLALWDSLVNQSKKTGLHLLRVLWSTLLIGLGIGRRRKTRPPYVIAFPKMYIHVTTLVLCASTVLRITEACSSRSTPKPRTPSPATRPNITFPTYACPPAYATWYCLNGATCFTVEISESILYNCVCADGYTGPRCEFKDLDGSYLPSRERVMVEKASIASGVTVAVILIVVISIAFYIYRRRQKTKKKLSATNGVEVRKQPSFSRSQRQSDERFSTRLSNQPDLEAGRSGNVRRELSPYHSQGSSSPPRDVVIVSRSSNP